MGKAMARIENGIVTNLEWVNDNVMATNDLKDVHNLQVEIGDTYIDGAFYRDNIQIVSYRQQIQNVLVNYDNTLSEIEASISIPAPLALENVEPPTIEERKQNILVHIADMLEALDTLEVSPIE